MDPESTLTFHGDPGDARGRVSLTVHPAHKTLPDGSRKPCLLYWHQGDSPATMTGLPLGQEHRERGQGLFESALTDQVDPTPAVLRGQGSPGGSDVGRFGHGHGFGDVARRVGQTARENPPLGCFHGPPLGLRL